MPTYEYKCDSCGHEFEAVQKITEKPLTECPNCKKNEAKRLISATAFHLKGSGWYKTDYASGKSSSGTSSAETKKTAGTADSTSSEAKSDSKSDSGSKENSGSEGKKSAGEAST